MKTGDGTLELSGANTYTGGTIVAEGTLLLGSPTALGDASASGAYVLVGNRGGTANAALLTSAGVTINRDLTVQAGSSGLVTLGGQSPNPSIFSGTVELYRNVQLTSAAGATTFSGNLTGPGAVNKIGSGTVILTNSNSYSGGTTVSFGSLIVNNTSGSGTGTGPVTVLGGALLGGNGSIDGSVTINPSAIISPGQSPGILGIGGDLSLSGIYHWDLANPKDMTPGGMYTGGVYGTDFDLLNVGGVFTSTGGDIDIASAVGAADSFWTSSHDWTISRAMNFNVGDLTTSGFLPSQPGSFSTSASTNELHLLWNPVPVPEPSTVVLALSALVGLGIFRRRFAGARKDRLG